jgi:hypothetical protein
MLRLQVTVDERQRRAIEAALIAIPKGMPMALSRALNKVAKPVESLIVKDAAKQTGMTQKVIRRKNIRLRRASWRNLTAEVRIFGRGIPVMMLKARQTRKGVTYKGPNGRVLIPGAFIATMPSGKQDVFKRGPGATRRELRERNGRRYLTELPIQKQRTPAVPELVTRSGAVDQARARAALRLPAEVALQARLVIEQHARKVAAKS